MRKRDVVLRLLRGDSLQIVSEETKVPILELERWRQRFLEAGRAGLRERPAPSNGQTLRDARSEIAALKERLQRLEHAARKPADPATWHDGEEA